MADAVGKRAGFIDKIRLNAQMLVNFQTGVYPQLKQLKEEYDALYASGKEREITADDFPVDNTNGLTLTEFNQVLTVMGDLITSFEQNSKDRLIKLMRME